MAKGIIISGRERTLKPWLSAVLSVFITGGGEVYSGSPQKGIILALIRITAILIIPFQSFVKGGQSYISGISASIILVVLITLISPICALAISFKKKRIIVQRYSSTGFILIFSLSSLSLLLLAMLIFFSVFSFTKLTADTPPLFSRGDIIALKRSYSNNFSRGESVLLKGMDRRIARVVALPGEKVSYHRGRFSIDGSDSVQSIFTGHELKSFAITDYEVISEISGNVRYPVINASESKPAGAELKDRQYFIAPDDRNDISSFSIINAEDISGRIMGILFSYKRAAFNVKPQIMNE